MVGFAFSETNEASDEITRLFDFIWPTAIALWNLRWQVDGFLTAVPDATAEDVASRFVVGSGITGADIRAMSTNTNWEDQKARFADLILTNAFSIYESWARALLESVKVRDMLDRDLYREGDGVSKGVSAFVNRVNITPSSVMKSTFQPQFMKHRKVFVLQQTAMLRCYRYFKEVRNCRIHNGGIADKRLLDAYVDFIPVSSAPVMKTKEAIEHYPVVVGERTILSLRGAVGFCDIVLRLMVTIDAQISGSKAAEEAALERMRVGIGKNKPTLSSNSRRSIQQISKICRHGKLPKPVLVDEIRILLLEQRMVSR